MVNKKTKKKTKWRSLELGPGADEEQTNDDTAVHKHRVPFKMEWKVNHNYNNNNSNNIKDNNSSSSNTYNNGLHRNSNSRFDNKRASSKPYSKYHYNTSSSTTNTNGGNHHVNKFEKQDKELPKKVQFNEDEYTRITTPRQDVLFKKGYLSRPKTQPTTPTHQPVNTDGIYTAGYVTADSPPLTLNGCSTNGTDYPYYSSHGAYINDALINGNVYGNPVFLMPYTDYFYPPPSSHGIDMDSYNNAYQYSPPLIEPEDNASQLVTSTTSTNCSESSEISEEITTALLDSPVKHAVVIESVTPIEQPTEVIQEIPIEPEESQNKLEPEGELLDKILVEEVPIENAVENVESDNKIAENPSSLQPACYETGYEMNPYLNPYAPVYYCVPQLPFYPVPALSPFEMSQPPEFYGQEEENPNGYYRYDQKHSKFSIKKRKKRFRKAMSSSGTSVTDYSEDDSVHQDGANTSGDSGYNDPTQNITTRPLAPSTPESIFEIAHQSTLNVEVQEFRPKLKASEVHHQETHQNGFTSNRTYLHDINRKSNAIHNTNQHYDTTPKKSKAGHYNSYKNTSSNNNVINHLNASNNNTNNNKKTNNTTTSSVNDAQPLITKPSAATTNGVNTSGTIDLGNSNANSTTNNVKKRSSNPIIDRKFIIESTKKIEMQNIDLKHTKTANENTKNGLNATWMMVGGKNRMVKVDSPEKDVNSKKSEETTKVTDSSQETVILVNASLNSSLTENVSKKSNTNNNLNNNKKTKPKSKHAKRNNLQSRGTKLQGFVIEEPTFNNVHTNKNDVNVTEHLSDDEKSEESNTIHESRVESDNDVDEDEEELKEAALIEEIPWTTTEVNEIEKYNQEDIIIEKEAQEVMIPTELETEKILDNINNNVVDCFVVEVKIEEPTVAEPEMEAETNGFEIEEKVIKLKTEVLNKNYCSESLCQEEKNETQNIINTNNHHDIVDQKVDTVLIQDDLEIIKPLPNGFAKHEEIEILDVNGICDAAAIIEHTEVHKKEICTTDVQNSFVSDTKIHVTAAVCNWIRTLDTNDLQSLFTIPLDPEIEKKIKCCSETCKFFEDDELQNVDKFITEHYFQYQKQISTSSSFSSLDDVESDYEDDEEEVDLGLTQKNDSGLQKKSKLKLFGCAIM